MSKKTFVHIIILVSAVFILPIKESGAQTTLFDSLKTQIDTLNGIDKVLKLQETAKLFRYTSLDKGLYFTDRSKELIEDIGHDSLLAVNYNIIGILYQQSGLDSQAEAQYKTSLNLYEKLNDFNGKATETHNLGIIYMDRLDTIKAIDYFKQSLNERYETGNNRRIGDGLVTLGEVYKRFGNYDKGISWLSRALEYYPEDTVYMRKFDCYSLLADSYLPINPDRSLLWIEEMKKMVAIDTADVITNKHIVNFMLGQYYLKTGNYVKSAEILGEISDYINSINNIYHPIEVLRELSARLYEAGEIEKSLVFSIKARNNKEAFEDKRIKNTISEYKTRLDFKSTEEEIRRTEELNNLVLKRIHTERLLKNVMFLILLSLTAIIAISLINYFKLKNDQLALSKRNNELNDANKKSILYKESILQFRDNKSVFFNILTDKLLIPFTDLTVRLTALSDESKKSFNKTKFLADLQNIYILAISIEKSLKRILMWSKIQRNKYEVNHESINVNDYMHEILPEILKMAIRRNIKVSYDIDPELYITFDRKSLRSIIKIFIENSIDNSPEKSEIIIRAKKASNGGVISVTDFGKGIDPSHQQNLFDIKRINKIKESRDFKNLGLGLLMSKHLAELNNSYISFESKTNKVTSFYLHIKKDNGRKEPNI